MNNNILKLVIGTVLFLYLSTASTQTFEWIIEPTFTEVDKIMYTKRQTVLNGIVVVKDGKYGVKNMNDEYIAPAQYTRAEHWIDGEYFGLQNDNRTLSYIDADGYEVSESQVKSHRKRLDKKKNAAAIEKINEQVQAEQPNFQVVQDAERRGKLKYLLNNAGDTILHMHWELRRLHFITDNLIAYSGKDSLFFYNNQGQVLKGYKGELYRRKDYGPYLAIREYKKDLALYNHDFSPVLRINQKFKSYNPEHKIITIEESDKSFLLDGSLKKINTIGPDAMFNSKDEKYVIFNYGQKCKKYTYATKEWKEYDFRIRRNNRSDSQYLVAIDSLRGIYNMLEDKMIIPIENKAIFENNGVVYSVYKEAEKNRSLTRKKKHPFGVYRIDGKQLLPDSLHIFYSVKGQGILLVDKERKGHKAISIHDDVPSKFYDIPSITPANDGIFFRCKSDSSTKYCLRKDFNNMDNAIYYDELKKNISLKPNITIIPVKKDGKWGMINTEGDILFPFELDEISEVSSYDKHMIVTKDGKIGVLRFAGE